MAPDVSLAGPEVGRTSTGWAGDRTLPEVAGRIRSNERVAKFAPDKLVALRKQRGYSHDRLVDIINSNAPSDAPQVNRGQIIWYEQGRKNIGLGVLAALAQALQVGPWELMDVTEDTATLADLRARTGLSKAAISERLGLSFFTWDAIERGRRALRDDVADRAAKLMGCPPAAVIRARDRGIASRDGSDRQQPA